MEHKFILDKNEREKSNFELNLNRISNIDNIDLSLPQVIFMFEKSILNKDFDLAQSYLNLASMLCSFEDCELNKMKSRFRYENIIFLCENLNEDCTLYSYIKILEDIELFFKQYYINSDEVIEYSKGFFETLKIIKDRIDIYELLKEKSGYLDKKICINDILFLKRYINEEKDSYVDYNFFFKFYEYKLNTEIKYIFEKKFNNKNEFIEDIKFVLKDVYNEKFLNCSKFEESILNIDEEVFNKYGDLLTEVNKEYLIYRFNSCSDLESKVNVLYNDELIPNYLPLPKIYKSFVVNNIISKYGDELNKEQFFNILNDFINNINNTRKRIRIPI